MAGIQASGVGSGLDINSLVSQLVSAENASRSGPILRREAAATTKISALKDAKTRLQEHLQGNARSLPVYTVKRTSGEPHAQTFLVSCGISQPALETEGEGPSRRRAEQAAAQAALRALGLYD
jgi:dsRNA-specific ribonuclease